MPINLPKRNKSEKQAESRNKRLGLFAMWNGKLPNLNDVELRARQLVNKLAARLPKKVSDNNQASKTGQEKAQSVINWPSSLPSWRNSHKQPKDLPKDLPKDVKEDKQRSKLPEFLQQENPNFADLKNFPNAQAEKVLAETSAESSQMPEVLADLKKKLNFDFLNSKEDLQEGKKVKKKSQVELSKLSEAEIAELLAAITVVAFVGPSGTGKSTRASQVAFLSKCNYIIDDALLIKDNHIVAGSSAKRAKTKIESVRQAIFLDPIRAQTMKRALASHLPDRLLILGTSKAMINKICQALSLTAPKEWVNISDVATETEIKQARYNRIHTGQHAIPVPSMELKHEFSGSIFEPLQLLKQRFSAKDIKNGVKEISQNLPALTTYALTSSGSRPLAAEQSIVRPSFSVLGHYSITDQALKNIVLFSLQKVEAVQKMSECKVRQETTGLVFNINLSLYYGFNAQTALKEAQAAIVDAVSRLTAMNILQVSLVAEKLVQMDKPRHVQE
ncbi:hypothetical protein [Amygdalobacter nucleatus]|uniref:hypothetical protein n=1 Tax=Amygdalobacter nucleatus TaxID=3029274 RepID=UPI0027A88A43|nr:hypothetical protein [Amygdalobacter nucleatus]WEG37298.1 hypothetical protein PYS63_02305 [Amygdalobacter nucleatus]